MISSSLLCIPILISISQKLLREEKLRDYNPISSHRNKKIKFKAAVCSFYFTNCICFRRYRHTATVVQMTTILNSEIYLTLFLKTENRGHYILTKVNVGYFYPSFCTKNTTSHKLDVPDLFHELSTL
jgi:hypothetical protein